MCRLLILVLVLTYLICPGSSRYFQNKNKETLCSTNLSQVVYQLCNGRLYEPPEMKKSFPSKYCCFYRHPLPNFPPIPPALQLAKCIFFTIKVGFGAHAQEESEEDFMNRLYTLPYPFLSKAKSSNFLKNRQKRQDQITNECCTVKPCSYEELKSYCAD